MKIQLIIFVLVLSMCTIKTNNAEVVTSSSKESDMDLGDVSDHFIGFIDFDLLTLFERKDTIEILNLDGEVFATLIGTSLILGEKLYPLKDSDESELSKLIGTRYFSPEVDFMVAQCFGVNQGFYEIFIGNERRLVKKSALVSLVSFENFFNNQLISINESPVRKFPVESSELAIENYKEYAFEVIETKGNWLKVRVLEDLHGKTDNSDGWVEWLKKDSILVEIMYQI